MHENKPKFSDIKPFIHNGNTETDVGFGYIEQWLESYEDELDTDPDFQRGHVWNDTQRSRYIEFLIRGGKSNFTLYWNHPSHTTPKQPNCNLPEKMTLVDGKQRLTACLKFLHNEIPIFGHSFNQFEDKRTILRPNGPRFKMCINNLQTRKELLQWYLDLNEGGTIHTKEELIRVHLLLEKE